VRLCANAQPGVSLAGLATYGAQGIGLYRSEYLWLGGNADPGEEEQVAAYSEAARAVALLGDGARAVFRALDLGGDKLQR
jgi:phosphotransferase system enzyme I (PtsI)